MWRDWKNTQCCVTMCWWCLAGAPQSIPCGWYEPEDSPCSASGGTPALLPDIGAGGEASQHTTNSAASKPATVAIKSRKTPLLGGGGGGIAVSIKSNCKKMRKRAEKNAEKLLKIVGKLWKKCGAARSLKEQCFCTGGSACFCVSSNMVQRYHNYCRRPSISPWHWSMNQRWRTLSFDVCCRLENMEASRSATVVRKSRGHQQGTQGGHAKSNCGKTAKKCGPPASTIPGSLPRGPHVAPAQHAQATVPPIQLQAEPKPPMPRSALLLWGPPCRCCPSSPTPR